MRQPLVAIVTLILAVIAFAPRTTAVAASSTQPDEVATALKAAKGIALVEVTAIRERDDRPSDGNLVDVVSIKTVKSTGTIPADIRITKDFGGRRVGAAPVPTGPLFPNPLVAGKRYWIIFNDADWQKYQQGVVAWWPEKDVPVAVEAAVAPAKTAPAADATAALNAGKSLALIEVTAIKEQDQRPADGDLFDLVSFKAVKSSGKIPADIRIIKGYAYPQMAGMPARGPVPQGILFPNPLQVGQRYWVIFNRADSQKYQDGITAWYPEKDAPAALDAAITADKFGKSAP